MGRASRGQIVAAAAGGGGRHEWTDERIRRELEPLLAGRTTWPTSRELQAAGREDLRHAISRYGGAAYWAKQFGLPLDSRQAKTTYPIETAIAEARVIIDRVGHLPGANRLRQMGYGRLATTVFQHGGGAAFCQRFDLPFERRAWRVDPSE